MAYTTPAKVRLILGIEDEDAPDEILDPLISDATTVITRRLSVRVINELPDGGYKTDNTEWYCKNDFIADTNGDAIIDKTDIHVYQWGSLGDESTKSEMVVFSLNPIGGRIVLTTAPINGYTVTVDYSYYLNQIDFDLVDLAAAYFTAKMWVERELMLVPPTVRIGRVTSKGYEYWNVCNQEFERTMHVLMEKPMDKVAYQKMVKSARGKTFQEEARETEQETDDAGIGARTDT
jgi:hypothetical protein